MGVSDVSIDVHVAEQKKNYPSISLTEMFSSLDTLRSTLKFEIYGAFMYTEILLQIKTK